MYANEVKLGNDFSAPKQNMERMDYKVVITIDAENDLNRQIRYLLEEKMNDQAARNVLNDFEETKERTGSWI